MIDDYIAYIRDVRRYSPRTQTLYADALNDFAQWLEMPDQVGHDDNNGHDDNKTTDRIDVMADLIGHLEG